MPQSDRTINGHTVIEDQPTEAPIQTKAGTPIYWRQVRTLLLSNGELIYGCAHCDYTSTNPNSIRPHLSAHSNGKRKSNTTTGSEVEHVLNQLSQLDRLRNELDHYKQRAHKAERDLRAIRRAIGGES